MLFKYYFTGRQMITEIEGIPFSRLIYKIVYQIIHCISAHHLKVYN